MTIVEPPLPSATLENARRLRRQQTDAERKLWQRLRGNHVGSWKFRRQYAIPPYIADFCCVEAKLIVELDGSQHTVERDAARTRSLESKGWRLVRFWDNDALLQTDAVLDAIWNILGPRILTPTPLPVGEGLSEHKP